ncbi:MAG: hypothetical protein ABS95_02640 [Verrucomicrobia bacterium SCN 57-15]|nr:MAG: hypothetical protein ABS95_02640 [Verrucomicrobia bacterium SCN 57-15]
MNADAVRQILAQSRSSAMQRAIIFTSFSCKQALAQCSHSAAHSSQASIQVLCFSCMLLLHVFWLFCFIRGLSFVEGRMTQW